MADRMAFWADRNWLISNEEGLDTYTFAVAGAVGLILSEIWAWY
jgi:farnesyl-diphosphate farnesyltransferase